MKYSLRRFLLISILLFTALMSIITIWGSYRASIEEVEELFDAQLSRSARLILGLALAQQSLGTMEDFYENVEENQLKLSEKQFIEDKIYQQGHLYELKLAYQIWDNYGNLILRSMNAPLQPMSSVQSGYQDRQFKQQRWRTFSLWDSYHEFQIITAERDDVRNELVEKITFQLTWPFFLLIPLTALGVWYFVGIGLKPLHQVAQEIAHRESSRLEPLKLDAVPEEIQPLVDELNHLLQSLQASFAKEKTFTSDAAHELRTPLAALKTHLQVLNSTQDESERQTALQAISRGVERASHLVEQLLGLARLEPEAIRETQQPEMIDLYVLCVDIVSELYPLANDKHQQISLLGDQTIHLKGYRFPIESMLRNLLVNSISYTPQKGEIHLHLEQNKAGLQICLEDSGPGIPQAQQQQVLKRFSKVKGRSQSAGSGIGLSIVKRVAELHQMKIEIGSSPELGGLKICLQTSAASAYPVSETASSSDSN